MNHHGRLRLFPAADSGNIAIMLALVIFAIFAAGGLAVDYAASLALRTRISNASDAATLATARAILVKKIDPAKQETEDYFKAVFAANMGYDSFDDSGMRLTRFGVDTRRKTVTAQIGADRRLTLYRAASGKTKQALAVASRVSYALDQSEVAMVLDVTMSMFSGGRLQALKDATDVAIDDLLEANTPTETRVRISLIPYDRAVNVGALSKYVYHSLSVGPHNRLYGTSDAPRYDPSFTAGYDVKAHWEPLGADCTATSSRDFHCVNFPRRYRSIKPDGTMDHTCATDRKPPATGGSPSHQYTDENPSQGMIDWDPEGYTCSTWLTELQPLTSDAAKLKAVISSLSGGNTTAGAIGLQWAWYTVSPNWADYLPAGSRPGDNAVNRRLKKYIIMMTDGGFNTAYAKPMPNPTSSHRWPNTNFARLCAAIKARGIRIFTVGFKTYSAANTVLRDCASKDKRDNPEFFNPESADDLKETYKAIAERIDVVRLTH